MSGFCCCCDNAAIYYLDEDVGRTPNLSVMGANPSSDLDDDVLLYFSTDGGCSVPGVTDRHDSDDDIARTPQRPLRLRHPT